MGITEWHKLVQKYFAEHRYQVFVPERGWGERVMKRAAVRLDPHRSEWRAAKLLGGTLAAVCKKAGTSEAQALAKFETLLRCPDCSSAMTRDPSDTLRCAKCGYAAANEGGVYNLLPSADRKELYPGDRDDVIDFSQPDHARHLGEGWYDLEGDFGNKYRWIGRRAVAHLARVVTPPQKLRIRGHASPQGIPGEVRAVVNGAVVGNWKLDRPGLFILETPVPDAAEYTVEIHASPEWSVATDDRVFTVNLSMIRLVPRE
jgi:predicted RNA-binding Zn-ribbon protein involved in translation (DUF1610 family)